MAHVIGLISDTHGLVRPDVYTMLADVEMILHAGDVGGSDILAELALIAPVRAVAGNTDPPSEGLASEIVCTIGGVEIHVSHGHEVGAPTPERLLERYTQPVLVYGHTHCPLIARIQGRLVINPGAAGPRRFSLLPSVARLRVSDGTVEAEIVHLSS